MTFVDTGAFLGRQSSYRFAADRARQLSASRELQILRPGLEDETAAIELFQKYADQKVSFTDCISFTLMQRIRIPTAFTFDQHFVRAGFKLWS